jgi:hypothetical protein
MKSTFPVYLFLVVLLLPIVLSHSHSHAHGHGGGHSHSHSPTQSTPKVPNSPKTNTPLRSKDPKNDIIEKSKLYTAPKEEDAQPEIWEPILATAIIGITPILILPRIPLEVSISSD